MTGDELKQIRHDLGMGVVEFGRAAGYTGDDNSVSVSIRRYEGGQKPVPPLLATLAMMFRRYGVPKDFLKPRE